MKKKSTKVKILDMKYEKEDHIFIMDVLDIDINEKVSFAMRAEDFGVTKEMSFVLPDEVMENFCKEMIGKEKNLFVEQDIYRGYDGELSRAEALAFQKDMDRFPYKELIRKKLNEG